VFAAAAAVTLVTGVKLAPPRHFHIRRSRI
jgi:hypothetical protein